MIEHNELRKAQSVDMEAMAIQLLTDFQSGSVKAFSKLYDLYVNVLFNYGCRLTTDKELLKDCIHDVFVKIYTKKDELGNVTNIKSYLFISLKNKLCDESRKRVNVSDAAIEDLTVLSSDDVENNYLVSEKQRIEKSVVKKLLGQLSERQREAFTLYYLEEREYDDICRIMNMNYQSVRNLMHRGMLKLRSITEN